jgi:hypothetical protein
MLTSGFTSNLLVNQIAVNALEPTSDTLLPSSQQLQQQIEKLHHILQELEK